MLPCVRVPIRVVPLVNESLRGFLMRLAERNGVSGADRILNDAIGGARLPITTRRALALADYCRCDVPEFFQLFGIEQRSIDGSRQWRLAGEWITKDYFLRSSRPSVCPLCLAEGGFLRGQWEVTFYVACPLHSIMLVERCSSCGKGLTPHRRRIDRCNCGFQFERAELVRASPEAELVAALVEYRIQGRAFLDVPKSLKLRVRTIEQFAGLDLDTLFKTLWLLGHCVGDTSRVASGHGRQRLWSVQASETIRRAVDLVVDWPDSLFRALEVRQAEHGLLDGEHPEAGLGPISRYLESEMTGEQGAFVRAAYYHFVHDVWRRRGGRTRARTRFCQLELF